MSYPELLSPGSSSCRRRIAGRVQRVTRGVWGLQSSLRSRLEWTLTLRRSWDPSDTPLYLCSAWDADPLPPRVASQAGQVTRRPRHVSQGNCDPVRGARTQRQTPGRAVAGGALLFFGGVARGRATPCFVCSVLCLISSKSFGGGTPPPLPAAGRTDARFFRTPMRGSSARHTRNT